MITLLPMVPPAKQLFSVFFPNSMPSHSGIQQPLWKTLPSGLPALDEGRPWALIPSRRSGWPLKWQMPAAVFC
jgi:hypothetical protein